MNKKSLLALGILLAMAESFVAAADQKRLQVELYGGIAEVNPKDLNSLPAFYNEFFPFYYVDRYEYYRQVGYIQDYDTHLEGHFRSLRQGLPIGLRVRYAATPFLGLSLGVRGFWGSADSRFSIDSQLTDRDGATSRMIRTYDPLMISAAGIMPLLGFHLRRNVSNGIGLEAFLAGGPIFGGVGYVRKIYADSGETSPLSSLLEMGSGVGAGFEAGLRLEALAGRDLWLFLEAGYAYQTVGAFKGEGSLRTASGDETWEGEWGMKEFDLMDYWGAHSSIVASNRWKPEEASLWRRGFKLDLSGAQVRVGIALRL